uniref:HAUS augmin like complex subunit 6 n=1 Tax=Nothoprocta perdicaria TaxID=30464 RepID=A0A8C7EFB9_NOTPE
MSSCAGAQWEKQHLWLYLLALGFEPEDGELSAAGGCALGADMFDAPNNEAFHTIALFLFTKLDPSRAAEMFRDCSLPGDRKGDPEFRKQCFTWLKEIAEEDRSTFPQIAASLFLSAGGPKFIDLMYQFARYVLIQDIKVNSVGTDIPFANIDNLIQDDPYLTKARCRTACNKLLQMLQKEDYIIREHKKKHFTCFFSSLLIKVRNMWTFVMDTLSSLKMEKEVVDSVLDGRADQYALDGTNFDITIPQVLINRIEGERHKIHEEEKLNFLTIVQLLNEALRIFRDEFNQLKSKEHLQYIRNEIEFQMLIPLLFGFFVVVALHASFDLEFKVLSTENFIWEEQPASANMLKDGVDEPTIEETGKNKDAHIIQRECPLREDSLEKAQQQLAEEVAKAVMYDSPQSSGEKGAELEDLISSLSSNPFITRKQIPRTPENLLTEIRSSWREAIRSEDSTDTEMLSSEVITETPKAVKAVVQKSIPNSTSSPVINFDYYHSERKSHLSCIELSPERQIKINHVSRSSVKETTRISENDRIEKQELENILNKTETVPYEKKSIDTQDSSSENRRRILSPEHLEDSFMDRIQLFSSSFDSHEPAQLGMFREILSDPGQSPSSELNFDIPDNIYLPGSRENERDISVDLESVLSRYETLKRTLSRSEEEQTPAADESLNCFSDLDFIRVDTEGTDLEKTFYLDEDFLNTLSSPVTFSESNPSLSPLLVRSRYLERMVSALNRMPFDSVHKLKDEEHLSKKLDTKEPL